MGMGRREGKEEVSLCKEEGKHHGPEGLGIQNRVRHNKNQSQENGRLFFHVRYCTKEDSAKEDNGKL